ncbi:MAG: ABC transporter ATP-binding protein [Eubacteriales bacterium]|nr:ABC transporter ATP-binding protein [Eubacteriales bacterium]
MIKLKKIHKRFEDKVIFEDFSLDIEEHKITCILGPSGIGKTTLLKLISGLSKVDYGIITGLSDKRCSFIFQEPRLIPWLNAYDNINYILESVYTNQKSRDSIIRHHLMMVGLSDDMNSYPDNLSGGMKQRLSIARAFAYPSDILLMDEPFNSLDMNLKLSVMESFKNLWKESNKTVIFITHDIDEAILLSNTLHIFDENPARIVFSKTIAPDIMTRNVNDDSLMRIKTEILQNI